jgi:hypothetical protein
VRKFQKGSEKADLGPESIDITANIACNVQNKSISCMGVVCLSQDVSTLKCEKWSRGDIGRKKRPTRSSLPNQGLLFHLTFI